MKVNMLNDIIRDHRERMLNLKKYYPFFRLTEVSFSQFKDGRYDILDMGYIVMGILRFFIEENNFKEKDVTYPEYLTFISGMLSRDFGLNLTESEYKDIADYIFDKVKNDGKPFDFEYFDPVDRKKRVSRIKMIESSIRDNTVWYSISPDAIEFYLDTKEIKDESRISVQQLLLEKMIRSNNFKGGTEVVSRINEEVNRLQMKKNEVMSILANDVFAGIEAYEEFVDTGMRWFEDEEKLFKKNRDLIESAMARMSQAEAGDKASESYYRNLNEIYELENQLKVAMNKHGDLLKACTDMQRLTDDAVRRAKLGRLRSHVDFAGMQKSMIEADNADIMAQLLSPLFKPKIRKTLSLPMIDDALNNKPARYVAVEKVSDEKPADIVFADEVENERIKHNYVFIMNNLLMCMKSRSTFTLEEFNQAMSGCYSDRILKNADYFSFFVNLCQKKQYVIGGGGMDKESFLDDILIDAFSGQEPVHFTIQMDSGRKLTLFEGCEVADVTFTVEQMN